MNPLGIHFIPTHQGEHHYNFIRAVQPGIVVTVGSEFPDVQLCSDSYRAAPDAIHVWRNHALSEQHADLWRDPINTGKRHAAEMVRDAEDRYRQARERGLPMPDRKNVKLLGVNEPVTEEFERKEDGSNYQAWLDMMNRRTPLLDAYMEAFGLECNVRGYGAELGGFSSGQPANERPGAYPTFKWFPKTRALLERTRGHNALAVHEYWRAETGPEGWWDWHTCRFHHLEGNFDIDVLECGVDQQITSDPPNGNRGWIGHMTPAEYAAQMGRYIRRAMTDPRFRCATPFTLDGGGTWKSFYIEPAMAEFAALAAELRAEARPSGKPSTVHIPVVSKPDQPKAAKLVWPAKGVITQRFGERVDYYLPAFGSHGHNGLDIAAPSGTPVCAAADGVVAWVDVDPDYGEYIRLWHERLGFHTFYAHLDSTHVQQGQAVRAGQRIGDMGSTGNSTGPHLHFEVRLGTGLHAYAQAAWGHTRGRVDPETVLAVLGVA